jgi:hypothetical protein
LRIKQCYTKSWIKVLDEATRQTYGLLVQDKRTTTQKKKKKKRKKKRRGGRGREGVGSTTETKKEGEEKGAKNKH